MMSQSQEVIVVPASSTETVELGELAVPPPGSRLETVGPVPVSHRPFISLVHEAYRQSNNGVEYLSRVLGITLFSTVSCGIWIAFLFAVPAAMVAIGSVFFRDCPAQRLIPIYLVVAGVIGIALAFSNAVQQCVASDRAKEFTEFVQEAKSRAVITLWRPLTIDVVLSSFLLAWFIAGSVWIYAIFTDVQYAIPVAPFFCNRTLYLFSFWLQTAAYIVFGVAIVGLTSIWIVMCCVAAERPYAAEIY